ncbi:MAG: sugar phosphate isomerase/epimerase [Bacteroidetes bacterium]|nr:sugar phosphate isomerase/epimerase [Bacteroidota bacterium]
MIRRAFITTAALSAIASSRIQLSAKDTPAYNQNFQFNLGIAGYSFAYYKDQPDEAIRILKETGVRRITLKDFHLPMNCTEDACKTIIAKFAKEGIEVYGLGVIYMKTKEEVRNAFQYAAKAGVGMIVGSPVPEVLEVVEEEVKNRNIRIAIHNHGPEDKVYPDIDTIHEKIANRDRRIGICLDIGHSFRCNHQPAIMLERFHKRVIDMHIKDVTIQKPDGKSTIPGRGIIDLKGFFSTVKRVGYTGMCSLEYEVPGRPDTGIGESIGYLRALTNTLAQKG